MLLVIAPQPRLDRVHFVERLDERESREIEAYAAHFEASGPGVVALRTARVLGMEARQLAFRGGPTGDILAGCYEDERFDVVWTPREGATSMGSVLCGCTQLGQMTRRTSVEAAPRVGDPDLRSFVASFEREVKEASGVLFVEPSQRGAMGVVMIELMRRCRARQIPSAVLCGGSMLRDADEHPPHIVVEGARNPLRANWPHELLPGMEARLWRQDSGEHRLELDGVALELDLPEAPDRGGDAPFEAALVAWLAKREESWPARMCACWGMAAATAQRLKEFGGRLSLVEVDGFFAQIRARELDVSN